MVISEFVNVFVRTIMFTYKKKDIKKFRNSKSFKYHTETIVSGVRKIIDLCTLLDSDLPVFSIDKILTEYLAGKSDFNDLIFSDVCYTKKLTLVTHDGDFKNHRGPILTANQNLLTK